MTVADLIYLLQSMPPRAVVVVPDRTDIRPLGTGEVQLTGVTWREDEVGIWLVPGDDSEAVLIGERQTGPSWSAEVEDVLPAMGKLPPHKPGKDISRF